MFHAIVIQMSMRRSNGNSALWIPGIQDCPEDREGFCNRLGDLDVQHPDVHYDEYDSVGQREWMQHKTGVEIGLIREQHHDTLIATSFGTHRAIDIINECPEIETAILMNPVRNSMSAPKKAPGGDNASLTEAMLRPLTLDIMDDDEYDDFVARHEAAYETESARIRGELRSLREGSSFAQLLEQCRDDVQLLVIQAPDDPWHIDEDLHHPNLSRVEVEQTYHYPHVSRPKLLAEIVHQMRKEMRQSVRKDRTQHGTGQRSVALVD